MLVEEYLAKPLLAEAGIAIPDGRVASTPTEAANAAATIGDTVALKAQVPAGKRGKSGGILFASSPVEAREEAAVLLGSNISGYPVGKILVEERVDICRELYAAIINDPASKSPVVLFSTEGGMDVEEISAAHPEKVFRQRVDIRHGFDDADARALLAGTDLEVSLQEEVARILAALYARYRALDAELVEINPLVIDRTGTVKALDCKLAIDDAARKRHPDLVARVEADSGRAGTALEREAQKLGLLYIELDGEVGMLANGAGLTMATMDVINHYGGRPANFLEIGGEAYTKAKPALELVLSNRRVKSLLVNLCGAFARTDVMAEGTTRALVDLKPDIPVFFSIHGTGEEEAIAMVRERLGVQPYEVMDDAVKAAIQAAGGR